MKDDLLRTPVPYALNRWLERKMLDAHSERVKAKIAIEVGDTVDHAGGPTAAGDTRKLRGIPAIGRGVAGAMADTDPERTLLKREARDADT